MLERGTVVAGYRIERALGKGGMGVVYEAVQLSLDRTVALKVLSSDLSEDESFRARFRREGRIQAHIDHPHIVTVHEAGETEFGLFIAMRLVRGPTLKDMILSRELDAGRTLRILGPVADALDTAHAAGLTHRDIKPQNVLVGARDHAYLADFGLTKATEDTQVTEAGQFLGTLDYISPEQIQGQDATTASDVYAFGATLYECLTGVVPYPTRSRAAVLYAHVAAPPPEVSEQRPELPPGLDAVIARAMAKDQARRHVSASDVIADAQGALGRRVSAAMSLPGPIRAPEELGVRPAEGQVSTREAAVPGSPVDMAPTAGLEAGIAAPATERSHPSALRRKVGLVVLAGIALAGVAGALAGGAGSSGSPSRARGSFVAGGPLQVVVPSAWQRVPVPRVPGLGLADAVAVGPPGQPTGVVLGRDTTPDATLLPSDLVSRLPRAPSTGQPVRVGDVEAYRYGALRPRGYAGTLIAYVAPTNRGVATVACFSTNAGIPVTSECPRVAASLTLAGATGRPLGPDPAYAATLSRAVAHLNAVRAATVSRLRLAKGPARQAQAADAIARAYAEASRTLSSSGTPPQARAANGRIVAALGASARWWAGLADAARHRSRAAYARRRSHVQQAETATARALRDLSRLGYRTTP